MAAALAGGSDGSGGSAATAGRDRGSLSTADVLEDYAANVRSFVDVSVLRPLKVVADTANGMGGLVVPVVFGPLPFDLEMLFAELDGTFPNHPADPIQPANLRRPEQAVLEHRADVGLAFDGDADRVLPGRRSGRAAVGLADDRPGRGVDAGEAPRGHRSSTT